MRRIDLCDIDIRDMKWYTKSVLIAILEDNEETFIADGIFDRSDDKCYTFHLDGKIEYCHSFWSHYYISATWKPHEYRQETRESCLYAYWYLKRRLGRDIAGIIAKFVWSTRFDYCWENLFTINK